MAFGALHDSLLGDAFFDDCLTIFGRKFFKRKIRNVFNWCKCRFGHFLID